MREVMNAVRYAGAKLKAALADQPVALEIVKRTDKERGFKVVRRELCGILGDEVDQAAW